MTTDDDVREVRRSSRDARALGPRLERWLRSKVGDRDAAVTNIRGTSATGMSSETLLFDARWTDASGERTEELVARIAPDGADVPVFPSYDLERQFRTIELVGRLTSVPVPPVHWYEPDATVIGSPFFVMGAVHGEAPPDVMPYNFGDSWLFDATRDEQRALQDATVDVLGRLHAIEDAERTFAFLELEDQGATPLERHISHTRAWYHFAAADTGPCDLIDRAFTWIEDHRPPDGDTVLCWGDARIGNVLYRGFSPVAVLDWEMAALGPRELDVAWLIYGHEVFEHLASTFGLGGMPHFMRASDVVATYEAKTGHTLEDLRFFRAYAALQYAIVFLRTGYRSVHFGERDLPADPSELLYNASQLEGLIS